jgi:uncharacterized membrane protein
MILRPQVHRLVNPFHLLLLFSAACLALLIVRFGWTMQFTYGFLAWNLFLAWIPLLISRAMQRYVHKPYYYGAAFGLWLLFLPNAPYIITDLLHLRSQTGVPIWFDALLLFSFAFAGLQVGLLSLYRVHQQLIRQFSQGWANAAVSGCVWLSSFGVYLGRFGRWNSWDLFTQPHRLLLDCLHQVTNPKAITVTIIFTFLLAFFYVLFWSLIHLKTHERTEPLLEP